MLKVESRVSLGLTPTLRVDELELLPRLLNQGRTRLRANAEPIDPGDRWDRAIAFHGHLEPGFVQNCDKVLVQLKHRLATGAHHKRSGSDAPIRWPG